MFPVIGVIVLLILVELFTPKPIDWTRNFNQNDKKPFGSFLVMDLLRSELFPNREIEITHTPIYNYSYEDDTLANKNFIFITDHLQLMTWDIERLLGLIKEGNQVLIAATSIGNELADSLHLLIKKDIRFEQLATAGEKVQKFENPKLFRNKEFEFEKAFDLTSIQNFNKDSLIVLGRDNKKSVQFVKIPIGKGNVFLCCQPLAFTNYNVLQKSNADYLAGIFSYLPNQPIVWDEYYKPLRAFRSQSPIMFLLSSPALKLAYYLLLICLVLFLIFQGKRQQRIIPVITALPNTSLEFIQTIGKLYYNRKNHKDIAEKKFMYLKEYIRNRYHLDFQVDHLDELSLRSGIPLKTLQILMNQLQKISQASHLSQEDLEDFHSKIEYIYNNCK